MLLPRRARKCSTTPTHRSRPAWWPTRRPRIDTADATVMGSSLLVEVKLNALDGGSLHLGAADGPMLHQRDLPYSTVSLEAVAS